MKPVFQPLFVMLLLLLAACDPMAPQATPVAVIVSPLPTLSPTPATTATPTPTPSATPTATPDFTPTATPFPCDEDSGRIVEIDDFRSPTAGGENLRYDVYLPPCYQELQLRYPSVILLHGLSYSETHWQELGAPQALDQGIRLGVLPPMILVMPYYGNFGQVNSFPPEPSYETVILEELMPAVEQDFCTINNREHRAIGGISRGGFWAYSIGMRHPDIFSIIGGHSSFFPENEFDVPAAFNPIEIARNSSLLPEANLRMYLDNGVGDSASLSQKNLSDELELRSIPHTYIINVNGEHNNDYWSAHVSEYLAFYGRNWPRSYDNLPTCLQPSP